MSNLADLPPAEQEVQIAYWEKVAPVSLAYHQQQVGGGVEAHAAQVKRLADGLTTEAQRLSDQADLRMVYQAAIELVVDVTSSLDSADTFEVRADRSVKRAVSMLAACKKALGAS